MTLELNLPRELEERLRHEADRRGQPKEAVALHLLDHHLPLPLDAQMAATIAMLENWTQEDAALSPEEAEKEAESYKEVLRALDEDRPSYRKLFTDILKDDPK